MEPIVRFVKIKPIRVAVFHAEGKSPEPEAYNKMKVWAELKGLIKEPWINLVFGNNNPMPTPGKEEYGYDCKIAIPPDMELSEGVSEGEIPGGLYIVVRTNLANITQMWMWLYNWAETEGFHVKGHGVEEHLTGMGHPDTMLLDLWLPIAEPGE